MWARCQYSPQYRLAVIALGLLFKLTSFLSPPVLTLSTQSSTPLSLLSESVCLCVFLYISKVIFVFPLGRTAVPGESIYWQDKKAWLVWDREAPLCPANLEAKQRTGVSNKVPPHSLYMQLHWKSPSATPSLLLLSLSLSPSSSLFSHLLSFLLSFFLLFFPRQNIHKVWIKLMTSRAALWKGHCRKKPYITEQRGVELSWKKMFKQKKRTRRKKIDQERERKVGVWVVGVASLFSTLRARSYCWMLLL